MNDLSGSRGIVRISHNPTCEVQAALVLTGGDEVRLAEQVLAAPILYEGSARPSAMRRGIMFERMLFAQQAALLRTAIAPTIGIAPEALVVHRFPSQPAQHPHEQAERRAALDGLLLAWAAEPQSPQLILQPPLSLAWPGLPISTVIPDALVLWPAHPPLPIEIKSAVLQPGSLDQVDRSLARRQAALQLLALTTTLDRVAIPHPPLHAAGFIAAQPRGLRPTPLVIEPLLAEHALIRTALSQLAHVRASTPPAVLADMVQAVTRGTLRTTYREWCDHGCALAAWCRTHHVGTVRALGDAASALVGGALSMQRIAALLAGTPPATAHEAALVELLHRVQADQHAGMLATPADSLEAAVPVTPPAPSDSAPALRVRVPRTLPPPREQ